VTAPHVPSELLRTLHAQATGRWRATHATFASAIEAAVARRFPSGAVTRREVTEFVTSLHLADLAVACACRDGDERAWEHVVHEYGPMLRTAARAMTHDGSANDLADSVFAELYAGRGSGGAPLLAHYHGRARLGSWLRTVMAQRHVDRYRAAKRTVELDESLLQTAVDAAGRDPHHGDYVHLVQRALDEAVAVLDRDDRLRLRLYYGASMKLAQIGRLLGEHEATVSRKLERVRRRLRAAVEARLAAEGLAPAAIVAAFEAASSAPELDASPLLTEKPE
jgi:RNA polymerase sigma-70 factor (ECF subfamily)